MKALLSWILCVLILITCSSCGLLSLVEEKPLSDVEQQQSSPAESLESPLAPSSENELSAFNPVIDPALTGTWVTPIDMSKMMQDFYTTQLNAEALSYVKIEELSFVCKMSMTFTEDGKVTATCDMSDAMDGIVQFTGNGLKRYVLAAFTAEAQKKGMTLEQYFAAAGIEDGNAYMDAAVTKIMTEKGLIERVEQIVEQSAQSLCRSGFYGTENDRIYTYQDQPNAESYNLYTVTGSVFILDLPDSAKADASGMAELFPLVFKKS